MGNPWGYNAIFGIFFASFIATGITAKAPRPKAISVPVRGNWHGIDGDWSSVSVRVGNPPQWVDLLASTASRETIVIGAAGCDESDQQCITERGLLFDSKKSTSWEDQGGFPLGLDTQLGFDGDGVYGFDSIAFNDYISVPSQIIGTLNDTGYWLGYFGLYVPPSNFTSVDKPSFLDSMVHNQSLIPSHSYGFTSGAHYQYKKVPASLTLGGYDSKRFVPNNVSFDLDDNERPVVAVNEIVVTAHPLSTSNISPKWNDNTVTLLEPPQADLFTIDSTTPYLWLPESVCLQFEKALGLVYDDRVQLYTFGTNMSHHDTLVNWNLTFDFVVADLPGSSKKVSLSLPYKAFDLQLRFPFPGLNLTVSSPAVNYFPLRKAANSTQYTIGRSFLQETYLIVDYERHNFSISQAKFSMNALVDIDLVDITRPKNSNFSAPRISQSSTMDKGEIAGVAVGAVVALALLVVIAVLGFRLQRDRDNRKYIRDRSDDDERSGKTKSSNSRFIRWLFRLPPPDAPTEIGGAAVWAFEAPDDKAVTELPDKCSHSELEGSTTDVPAYQEADRKHANAVNAIGHDPEKPVELPYRSSTRGFFDPDISHKVQFAPPTHDSLRQSQHYRMSRHNTQTTAGISSPSDSPSRMSSKPSSPTFLVSPISPNDTNGEYGSLGGMARREAWYVANDDHRADLIPRRPTPAVSLLSESIHSQNSTASTNGRRVRKKGSRGLRHQPSVSLLSESGESECSNGSTMTSRIRRSISRGFSWDPDSCLDQAGPSMPRSAPPPASFNPPSRWNGIRPSNNR